MIQLKLGGPDHVERADFLMELLPEMEFAIAGHIVADLCIDERVVRMGKSASDDRAIDSLETVLRLSVLTIEDW